MTASDNLFLPPPIFFPATGSGCLWLALGDFGFHEEGATTKAALRLRQHLIGVQPFCTLSLLAGI